MGPLFVGLYGLYVLMVGAHDNAHTLVSYVQTDGPPFITWLGAIIVLSVLHSNDNTRPIVAPFATLLIIAFALKNWPTISTQTKELYSMAGVKL